MPNQYDQRTPFDWTIFILIHVVLVGAIFYAAGSTYGYKLGIWVGASAFIAALVSLYLFHVDVPGETAMKIILGLAVACNAGYLVYNGAQAVGIEAFNLAQVKKFEAGVSAASRASSRQVARQLGLTAKSASTLEKAFGDSVSVVAGLLSFAELALSIIIFAVASARHKTPAVVVSDLGKA